MIAQPCIDHSYGVLVGIKADYDIMTWSSFHQNVYGCPHVALICQLKFWYPFYLYVHYTHCTIHYAHYTMHIAQFTLRYAHCAVHNAHCTTG